VLQAIQPAKHSIRLATDARRVTLWCMVRGMHIQQHGLMKKKRKPRPQANVDGTRTRRGTTGVVPVAAPEFSHRGRAARVRLCRGILAAAYDPRIGDANADTEAPSDHQLPRRSGYAFA
jgi:hypothetical protein